MISAFLYPHSHLLFGVYPVFVKRSDTGYALMNGKKMKKKVVYRNRIRLMAITAIPAISP